MKIKELIDKDSFDAALEDAGDSLIVIDFFATWCGPCKRLTPQLVALAEKYPKAHFYKINVEENKPVAAIYKVTAMPMLVFIKEKITMKKVVGADIDSITAAVKKYA